MDQIWDAENPPGTAYEHGGLLVTLIGGGDGDWLAITSPGFFAASRKGNEMLTIVRRFALTSVHQIHQSLFNPDLVRQAAEGDRNGEVQKASKIMNLKKVLDSGPAPTVALTSHTEGSRSSAEIVSVTARITDSGKGVGRIEWRVGGITAAVISTVQGEGPDYLVSRALALDPGENIIEIVAYNGSNLLASKPARTTINFAPSGDAVGPNLHVLAVGINTYVDQGWIDREADRIRRFPPLSLAVKDAETFGAEIKRAAGSLYEDVIVTYVLDKDATRENLENVVDRIARDIHPRDTFIFFAAAHGTSEHGRFYLIPQDYQGSRGALEKRAIGQDRLQDWLANRIKAKKAIILLDTCESGALVAGHLRSRTEEAASEAGIGRLHEATGRPVLTAAATGQFAHEGLIAKSGDRQGIFTWALLDALRDGDTNGNGKIELSELVAHVQNNVPALAAMAGGKARAQTGAPQPTLGKQTARFGYRGEDFAIANRVQSLR